MPARTSMQAWLALVAVVGSWQGAAALEPNFYERIWGLEGTAEEIEDEQVCMNGDLQSPINLPADVRSLPKLPETLVTKFNFPTIQNPTVANTGHNLQMNWDTSTAFDMEDRSQFPAVPAGGSAIRDALENPDVAPDRTVSLIPIQMHWHEVSEHSWEGLLGAAEAHIVSYVAEGDAPDWGCDVVWGDEDYTDEEGTRFRENCIAVFGVMFRLADEEDVGTEEFFFQVDDTANVYEDEDDGAAFPETTVDLNKLLPEDKSYFSYVGSLTTPPCTEGLRWHVFHEMLPMSLEAYHRMEQHVARTAAGPGEETQHYRHNNRDVQPFGGNRTLYFSSEGGMHRDGMKKGHKGHETGRREPGESPTEAEEDVLEV